jgi:hypothetical protein
LKTLTENNHDPERQSLKARWEEAIGQPLTEADLDEILYNVRSFFDLLIKWKMEADALADEKDAAEREGEGE